ncbi:MAG TPA: hypothetical protein VNM69_03840 [Bacillus sp. (in: firmicutes)]|nr:hypothetical protein [Bacillus sp. (in: firmicutes)]
MQKENIIEFLKQIKNLISKGKYDFITRKYKLPNGERLNYIQSLLEIGLTNIDDAWKEILSLTPRHYFRGPTPDRDRDGEVWEFKKEINGVMTYIKLKIDRKRGCVCMSFHKDW